MLSGQLLKVVHVVRGEKTGTILKLCSRYRASEASELGRVEGLVSRNKRCSFQHFNLSTREPVVFHSQEANLL